MKIPAHATSDGCSWSEGPEIDRLVDGSLGEEQRKALLLKLDALPGGWKQCALAYLEAQTFREALAPLSLESTNRGLAGKSAGKTESMPTSLGLAPAAVQLIPAAKASAKRRKNPTAFWFAAAFAACAFWAGWALKPASTPLTQDFAQKPTADATQDQGIGQEPSPVAVAAVPNPDSAIQQTKEEGAMAAVKEPTQPVAALVPTERIFSQAELQLRSLEEAIRQMEKKGYRADVQSQWVAVKTPDGRTVEIPVRELRLKYQGKQTY